MKKINIAIIFGGRSAEHEVSIQSAKNIIKALDKNKYNPVLIGIDKNGHWYSDKGAKILLANAKPLPKFAAFSKDEIVLVPQNKNKMIKLHEPSATKHIDVAFPILHGPFGEDGTIQGLLKLAGVPFVGASVLGSAIGMDKEITKRLLKEAGIPICKFIALTGDDSLKISSIIKILGLPLFVKPANLGSSVGISKVKNKKELLKAIILAFQYDNKILMEESIVGREIECAVLGNEQPIASVPGEIIVKDGFYSYEAKYLDEHGAILKIPAKLPPLVAKKIQKLAIKTFRALACEGMARVDFFLKKNGEILVNEINTIPGFTSISIYPKLFEKSGINYSHLIDKLIKLALERFNKEKRLKISR